MPIVSDPPEAVIVGGGIAGLASAKALALTGWRCTVLEPHPPSRRRGHGLLLPASSRRALERLGVAGLERVSTPIEAFELCRHDGQPLQHFAIPGSAGLLRRDLVGLLQESLPISVTVMNSRCVALEADGGNAYQVVGEDRRRWRAQLIVAADGVGSACRRFLFPQARLTPELVTELVLSQRHSSLCRQLEGRCRKFQDPASGLALGLLPCRADQLVVYAQFTTARHACPRPGDFERFLRCRFGSWNPMVQELLADLQPEGAHLWHTTDLDPLPQLHRGNVVLLGDSAHPLLPFTSQGSAAALEDALALAAALWSTDGRDPQALRCALEAYSAQRGAQVRPLLEEGRELRRVFLDPLAYAMPLAPLAGFEPPAAALDSALRVQR